jgi:hypothetical protein
LPNERVSDGRLLSRESCGRGGCRRRPAGVRPAVPFPIAARYSVATVSTTRLPGTRTRT